MSNFTKEQKAAFLSLAEMYDEAVYKIAHGCNSTEIFVHTREEANALDKFSSRICGLVYKDHPDIAGADEGINADAEMVVYMISDILEDSGFGI
jgi:hypothetical protein